MKEHLYYLRLLAQQRADSLNTALRIDQLVNGETPLTEEQQATLDVTKQMNTTELLLARKSVAFMDEAIVKVHSVASMKSSGTECTA